MGPAPSCYPAVGGPAADGCVNTGPVLPEREVLEVMDKFLIREATSTGDVLAAAKSLMQRDSPLKGFPGASSYSPRSSPGRSPRGASGLKQTADVPLLAAAHRISGSSWRGREPLGSTTPKSVKISEQLSVHIFEARPAEKRDQGISCSPRPKRNQLIRRSGTYASLGLGYIVDQDKHEQEIVRRNSEPNLGHFLDVPTPTRGGKSPRTRFTRQYDILREIRSGTFSTVFVAAPKTDRRHTVAVKRVNKQAMSSLAAFGVFRTETQAPTTLEHANIAWPYEVFNEEEHLYLVMELLAGPSLFDRVSTSGVLAARVACRYLHEMLSGLAYLHSKHIMHRDVKPENYMLDCCEPQAQLKLVDFTVSRAFRDGDMVSTQVGTLAYTAPEVLDQRYNAKCDVWSCGATIFVCCAGRLPVSAARDDELMEGIREGAIAWSAINRMPRKLVGVIQKMLTRSWQHRPSAADLCSNDWLQDAAFAPPGCCGFL